MNHFGKGLGLSPDGAFVTSESHATKENRAGEVVRIPTREGYRTYRYMQAQEAIAIGQIAAMNLFIDNADVDAAASTSVHTLTGTGDFTAGEFGNTFPSAFTSIDEGTGANQTRAINQNTANILTLENNNWDVALDTTSDFVTYDINYVILADSDEAVPLVMGVAISAIAASEWGWFQVGGFCPLVRFIGTTDPAVKGEGLVVSATAGVARGFTTGGTTADEASNVFGKALHASAVADVTGAGVAAMLYMPWAC